MSEAEPAPNAGVKHDAGKLPWHLLPTDALREVVRVLQHGAEKYGERNWEKGMNWSRVQRAALGHLADWDLGEPCDKDTRMTHLAHFACNAIFLLAFELRGVGVDDRPRRPNTPSTSALEPHYKTPPVAKPSPWQNRNVLLEPKAADAKPSIPTVGTDPTVAAPGFSDWNTGTPFPPSMWRKPNAPSKVVMEPKEPPVPESMTEFYSLHMRRDRPGKRETIAIDESTEDERIDAAVDKLREAAARLQTAKQEYAALMISARKAKD